jgi:hypothetical protein
MRIAFDVGGVLSKYAQIRTLFNALSQTPGVEVFVVSDMHPKEMITKMLSMNDLNFKEENVISADYKQHGEQCKKVVCEELGLDILIDDFIGYVAQGKHVRFLVMPDPDEDYYSDDWKTDGSEGNFGRRKKQLKLTKP